MHSRICRRRVTRASKPSISGSPCAQRSFRLATLGVSWHTYARPKPSPMPLMTLVGWDRSWSFCQTLSTSWVTMTRPLPHGQRALALATASGEVVLRRWRIGTSALPTKTRVTIVER